jgi:hypothetical protein
VRDKTSGTLHLLTAASVVQGLEASIVSALRKPLRLLLPQHLQGQVAGCIQSPPLQVNPGEGICIGQAGATSGGAALIDLDPNLGVTNLPLDSTWHIHKASAHPPESAKVEIATDGGRLLAHIDSQATQSACGLAGQLRLKLSPSQTIGGEQLAGLAGTPVLAAKGNVKELVAIVTCASDGMLYAEPILQVLANLGVELVETREYPGACDASAIAAVGEGFLAASDERISSPSRDGRGNEKKKNAIRVYRSLNDKPAIAELSRYKDEIDIEGAAFDFKSNDRIFWIGSLGLDRHGEPARQRDCLIATDLAGQETTTRCRELREQICAALKLSGGDCAKWDGAVEGLTMHEDGSLLLGLRRPLLGDRELNKKAFILKLTNPSLPDETPVFQVLSVYLKGQGIRAMETTTGKGLRRYYLISGPSERVSYSNFSERAMFHLYEWDGKEGGMGLQEVEFPYGSAGGAYEGLMFDKNTGRLWASRDSDHLSDQFPCKDRKSEEQSYLMVDLGQNLRKKGAPMPGPQVEK